MHVGSLPGITVCAPRPCPAVMRQAIGGGIGFAAPQVPMRAIAEDILRQMAIVEETRAREMERARVEELEREAAQRLAQTLAQEQALAHAAKMAAVQKTTGSSAQEQSPYRCVVSALPAEGKFGSESHCKRGPASLSDRHATISQHPFCDSASRVWENFDAMSAKLGQIGRKLLQFQQAFDVTEASDKLVKNWLLEQEDIDHRLNVFSAALTNLKCRLENGDDLNQLDGVARIVKNGMETFEKDVLEANDAFTVRLKCEDDKAAVLRRAIRHSSDGLREIDAMILQSHNRIYDVRVSSRLENQWAQQIDDFEVVSARLKTTFRVLNRNANNKRRLGSAKRIHRVLDSGLTEFKQEVSQATQRFETRFIQAHQDAEARLARAQSEGGHVALRDWSTAIAEIAEKRFNSYLTQRKWGFAATLAEESDGRYTELQIAEELALMKLSVNGKPHPGCVVIAVGNMPDDGMTWCSYGMSLAGQEVWARAINMSDPGVQDYIVANAPHSSSTHHSSSSNSNPRLIRWPDFANLQIDYFVGSVWLNLTRDGNVFFGFGVRMPFPDPVRASVGVSLGWLNRASVASGDTNKFASRYGGSMSATFRGSVVDYCTHEEMELLASSEWEWG